MNTYSLDNVKSQTKLLFEKKKFTFVKSCYDYWHIQKKNNNAKTIRTVGYVCKN